MQDHTLKVGEAAVLDGDVRLTVLAVEEGRVVVGVTAPGLIGVEGPPEGRPKQRPRLVATPPLPSEN